MFILPSRLRRGLVRKPDLFSSLHNNVVDPSRMNRLNMRRTRSVPRSFGINLRLATS
ncbi:hypothetical protein BMETH_1825_0 [methanotrophic bacterial endosymbiont of Bathymodiolus sp.]|nr:hypothetical protein BMETH_1825_0 [methanotrophic bacterial endosymbiont of Bathymodiolus sp.]